MSDTPQVPEDSTTEQASLMKKRSKTPLIAGILAGVLVLGGAGTAYGYVKHDLFKSPKQVYLLSELQGAKNIATEVSKDYKEYYDGYVKPYLDSSVSTKQELSAKVTGLSLGDPQVEAMFKTLGKSKITVQQNIDPNQDKTYVNIGLVLDGKELLAVELFSDKTKVALGVPTIYDKYVVADLQDRDKLKERYGVSELPKRIVTNKDIVNAIKITKEEVTPILTDYGKFYADNIKDEQVVSEKTVFQQEGTKVNGKKLTVTFTEDEYKDFEKNFVNKVAKDESLLNLIYTRYSNIYTLYTDAGYSGMDTLKSKEEFKQELQDALDEALIAIDTKDIPSGVTMAVIVDSDHNILERKITFSDVNTITYSHWTDSDKKENTVFNLKDATEKGPVDITLAHKNKAVDSTTDKGSFEATLAIEGESSTVTTDFTTIKEADKRVIDTTFNLSRDENSITGDLKSSATTSDKGISTDTAFKVVANIPANGPEKISLDLAVTGLSTFGDDINLPTLTADNSLDVVNMSEQDLLRAQQDIMKGVFSFLQENASIMQSLIGSVPMDF